MNTVVSSLIQVVLIAINIYVFVLIASAVMSWLIAFDVLNRRNPLVATIGEFLYRITEPALRPIRRFIPHLGGIDISPVVLILILYFFQLVLSSILRDMYRGGLAAY